MYKEVYLEDKFKELGRRWKMMDASLEDDNDCVARIIYFAKGKFV